MDILKNLLPNENHKMQAKEEKVLLPTGMKPSEQLQQKKIIAQIAGTDFVYTKENKKLLNEFFHYFNGNVEECEKLGIDLNKSIALLGEYGCGKTMLFRLMHKYLGMYNQTRVNSFRIVSIEDVLKAAGNDNFIESPYIYNVCENEHGVKIRKPIHLLVNEFGAKYNIKTYGTDVNELLEMFWMKRYEIYTDHKKLTHITTNLDLKDIVGNNSDKLVDRFKEMFQFKKLTGSSFRK